MSVRPTRSPVLASESLLWPLPDGVTLKVNPVISARGLTKRYESLVAVDGINFVIDEGECFGFLGPNGAGKTTTMKMICCASPVTQGELWVDGKEVRHNHREIKAVLGIVSQADSLDPDLSVIQNLLAFGRYFNLSRKAAKSRAWEALEMFRLQDKAHNRPDALSGGMRRRLLVARALLNEPKILVLDEPTTGLDPQTRLMVWDRLFQLKSQGKTILLTTHYMEEAAHLCDRLVVMDTGKIIAEGSPEDLIRRRVGDEVMEIRTRQADKPDLMDLLKGAGIVFEDGGDSVLVYSDNGQLPIAPGGLERYQVVRRPGNLEDVFLRLTGRGLREE